MSQKDTGTWYENAGGLVQSNEWYTPPEIFIALKTDFDLDVASPKEKIPWIPADYWFHEGNDGLKKIGLVLYGVTRLMAKIQVNGYKSL